MTATKESLLEELQNARLIAENIKEQDTTKRKELSEMLGFVKTKFSYGSEEKNVEKLSWPQIYFEIGKLKADKSFLERLIKNENDVEYVTKKLLEIEGVKEKPFD